MLPAVVSVCLALLPTQCEKHEIRIERSACGLEKRAEVPLNGQWHPAVARIECLKKRAP